MPQLLDHPIDASVARPPSPFAAPFPDLVGRSTPFRGLTVLLVEDSRFAAEALRLLCQRSGLRLRRAESIAATHAHLHVYRPDAVIIDLGLPDGDGAALIAELARQTGRPRALIGTSGTSEGRARALDAGADDFLDKPIKALADFLQVLSAPLGLPLAPLFAGEPRPLLPDPLALKDDLSHACAVLSGPTGCDPEGYVSAFLHGLARSASDPDLDELAELARHDAQAALGRLTARLNAAHQGGVA